MPKLSAVTLVAGVLVLAACGSSSKTTSSATTPSASTAATTTAAGPNEAATEAVPAGNALTLEANPEGQLKYNKTSLSATAGKVSIAFTNSSPLEHNVTVESSSGKILGATPTFKGATKVLTLDLKAGTFKFFCSVPGHRQAGMEGTLTVK